MPTLAEQNVMLDDTVMRLIAEHESFQSRTGTDYAHSRNLTGEPSEKNRVYRASDDCWKRGMSGRTRGTAATAENGLATEIVAGGTVHVILPDGTSVIRSADSFRPERIAKKHAKQRAAVAKQSYADRVAQLGAIGNVE